MTHPTAPRVIDTVQLAKWRDELAAQDADPEAMPATETNDVGRDLQHFPHGWYVAWAVVGLVVIGAIAGVIVVAQMLGPQW